MRSPTKNTWTRAAVATVAGALLAACASGGGLDVRSGSEEPDDLARAEVVPEGATITAQLDRQLSVEENEEGDTFHATVSEPVVRDGETLVPEGALIRGKVTAVQQSDEEDEPNVMKLQFDRIEVRGEEYALDSELIEATPETESGETLTKTGVGAAAGAVIGGILGEDAAGALIGAGIGAAAGTAVALGTQDEQAMLKRGSDIRLRVASPIRLDRNGDFG